MIVPVLVTVALIVPFVVLIAPRVRPTVQLLRSTLEYPVAPCSLAKPTLMVKGRDMREIVTQIRSNVVRSDALLIMMTSLYLRIVSPS